MTSGDNNDKERERQKLLEDIRRRAEEAELKRIEEEERKAPASVSEPSEEESPPAPMPPKNPVAQDSSGILFTETPPLDEQRLIDLRQHVLVRQPQSSRRVVAYDMKGDQQEASQAAQRVD